MKKLSFAAAAAMLVAFATPAAAQNPQTIEIIGTAEAFCSLPSSWQWASSTNNVSASQFSGHTWTIPSALLADSSGQAVESNAEVAIRVRGQASCNTTHIITLTSTNGGLAHAASAANPPVGFTRRRPMIYNANWTGENWGIVNWTPATPGASTSYDHGARVPPGNHEFDVRMGLVRGQPGGPMIAGDYSDQLIITITVPS